METSMLGGASLNAADSGTPLHAGFPIEPDKEFAANAALLLQRLGLEKSAREDYRSQRQPEQQQPLLASTPVLASTASSSRNVLTQRSAAAAVSRKRDSAETTDKLLNSTDRSLVFDKEPKIRRFAFRKLSKSPAAPPVAPAVHKLKAFVSSQDEESSEAPAVHKLKAFVSSQDEESSEAPAVHKLKAFVSSQDEESSEAPAVHKLKAFVSSQEDAATQYRSQVLTSIFNLRNEIEDDFELDI